MYWKGIRRKVLGAAFGFAMLVSVGFAAGTFTQASYVSYGQDRDRNDRRDRDYRNGGYGNNGYNNIYRAAQQNGYQAGFVQGDSDVQYSRPYNPRGGRVYREGTQGYYSAMGSKRDYKNAFQHAFQQGYDEGFRRRGRNRGGHRGNRRRFPY